MIYIDGRAPVRSVEVQVIGESREALPTAWDGRRPEKKAEALARQMLEDILSGELGGGGTTLPPESALLDRYRVGRTTVREAQRILEMYGLLEIRPGPAGGAVFTAATSHDYGRMAALFFRAAGVRLHHLLEARHVMEALAAGLAARQGDAEKAQLRELVDQLERGPELDYNAFTEAGRRFHDVILGMCGNPITSLFAQALIDMYVDRILTFEYPPEMRDQVVREHIAIGRAILDGDAVLAELLMRTHMDEVSRLAWQGWSAALNEVIAWR